MHRLELNYHRPNGVVGSPLVKSLSDIYLDHGLHEYEDSEHRAYAHESEELPLIVCMTHLCKTEGKPISLIHSWRKKRTSHLFAGLK